MIVLAKKKLPFPPFSVLISIYPSASPLFLSQALESIVNQTVKPSEIVLVEDGTVGERLEEVVEKYQMNFNGNFKIIKLKRNGGLGRAMQIGTKHVSTSWIARMDADDICVPNRFELQLKRIESDPELAIVGGQIDEFTDSPNQITGHRIVPRGNSEIINFIKYRCPFNHPTVMINKDKLQRVGGYLPYGTYEDYYLWSRFIAAGYQTDNLSEVLVHMRVNDALYGRRGQYKNLRYIFKLRRFMYKQQLTNGYELIAGLFLDTINVIIPRWLRKNIYKKVLRK